MTRKTVFKVSTYGQGKPEKSQGKVREKSGKSVSKIWQTPCTTHKLTRIYCQWSKYWIEQLTLPTSCVRSILYSEADGKCKTVVYMFFYKHNVFQSEARICLSFSQIQPPVCLKYAYQKHLKEQVS